MCNFYQEGIDCFKCGKPVHSVEIHSFEHPEYKEEVHFCEYVCVTCGPQEFLAVPDEMVDQVAQHLIDSGIITETYIAPDLLKDEESDD